MSKIVFSNMVSLDGYMEDRDGSISWSTPAEDLHRYANDQARETATYLLGRGLYEAMEPAWPDAARDLPGPDYVNDFARIWIETPRLVFSKTLEEVGPGCELRREVDPDEIRELKAGTEGILQVGGPGLAGTFARLGLVDEVNLMIHPIILGQGKAMFRDDFAGTKLVHTETRKFGSGALSLNYQVVTA